MGFMNLQSQATPECAKISMAIPSYKCNLQQLLQRTLIQPQKRNNSHTAARRNIYLQNVHAHLTSPLD